MKKTLSILLCLAVLAMTVIAVIPTSADESTPNILALADMDYQYYHVGAAVATAPDVTDGVITPGEYSYSEEWTSTSTTGHTSDANPNLNGVSGTNDIKADASLADAAQETLTMNFAYDNDWVYIAAEANAPTSAFRTFGIHIKTPNPTTYGTMMDGLFYWIKTAADCTGETIAAGTHKVEDSHFTWGPRNSDFDEFGNFVSISGRYVPTNATSDMECYLTYDETGEKMIVEFKVKKSGLAEAFGVEAADINMFGFAFFHVYTNDVATPVYQDDYKIAYYMQILDDDQATLLEDAYWLDITPAWVPYYIHLGNEADFVAPTPVTLPSTTTAAATTKAATTKAATTAAATDATTVADETTAAPAEEKGCGGFIGLSAIALVPTAILGMAVATKKKED